MAAGPFCRRDFSGTRFDALSGRFLSVDIVGPCACRQHLGTHVSGTEGIEGMLGQDLQIEGPFANKTIADRAAVGAV